MTKKTKTDWKVICTAITGIVILECVALQKGIDGLVFAGAVALIAGLAGYAIPSPLRK